MGLSEKRAAWVIKWLEETTSAESVLVRGLVEGLGRLGFAAGVLEYHRPFLAPIYAWTASVPPGAFLELPIMVKLSLKHLLGRFRTGGRMSKCLPIEASKRELFRTDASADDQRSVLGGYEVREYSDTTKARWFSIALSQKDLPEFFKGDTAKRTVAAWEMLATLVALKIFSTNGSSRETRGLTTVTGATDNQGNPYAINRLMTTKFPLNVLVMELATMLEEREL